MTLFDYILAKKIGGGGGETPEPPLPTEYQEVEHIDFTPHCGYLVTIPASFLCELKVSPDITSSGDMNWVVLGYRVSNSSDSDLEIYVKKNKLCLWMRGAGSDPNLEKTVSPGDVVTARGFFSNTRTTAFLGRYATYASQSYFGWDGKIYYVKGWDVDGNLSFKFVPCYRKADNVPGYYDVVAGVFYSTLETTGGGSISVGPDVN